MNNSEGQVQELPIEVTEQMESVDAVYGCYCGRWHIGEGVVS
ncbi:hypothetical protein [Clostridium felsineum]|nr:hypothetical protein [Clostridium felsineum]URZ00744.1 hypothetical protein CLAUR_007320 [Clostridium felsineum]